MHRWLSLALMPDRAAQGFAIHCHMGERPFLFVRLQSAGFCPTLFHGSCFQQYAGDHCDELLRIAAGQRLTIRRIGRKPLRPVQLAAQPPLSFFDPIHDAIHRRFSGQFPQHQQGQQQGQRIAFAFLLASIGHLFKRAIQGGRIDGQCFNCSCFSTLKYAKLHLRHFSLS